MTVIVRINYSQHLQKGNIKLARSMGVKLLLLWNLHLQKGNTCIKLAFTVHL